jgi:hypothetical protein
VTIPDGFGQAYRDALFSRVSSTRATRVGVVFLDTAYATGSLTIDGAKRGLRRACHLSGWNVDEATAELLTVGLLAPAPEGPNKTSRWTLQVTPEEGSPVYRSCGTAGDPGGRVTGKATGDPGGRVTDIVTNRTSVTLQVTPEEGSISIETLKGTSRGEEQPPRKTKTGADVLAERLRQAELDARNAEGAEGAV